MANKSEKSRITWAINGLGADRPDPELKDKLMLFGQFVGDWDIIEDRYPQPDGTEIKHRGEVHFGWILDGKAVQDVWMTYQERLARAVPDGTTIRFYDRRMDAWHVTWIAPDQGVVRIFIARKIGEEIVLEGKSKEGYPEKWIFSDITPTSFRWHSEETRDNGKTWQLTEDMRIRKSRAPPSRLRCPAA